MMMVLNGKSDKNNVKENYSISLSQFRLLNAFVSYQLILLSFLSQKRERERETKIIDRRCEARKLIIFFSSP